MTFHDADLQANGGFAVILKVDLCLPAHRLELVYTERAAAVIMPGSQAMLTVPPTITTSTSAIQTVTSALPLLSAPYD
jgi:hypothetical protein